MLTSIANTAAGLSVLRKFVFDVFPLVDRELECWRQAAGGGRRELTEQALDSIHLKKFHCQGGSVYSLYRGVPTAKFVRLVVALQTISDYLDNLCDRAGITDEPAFRQLHLAMTDALDPEAQIHDYYAYYPYQDDGGYLRRLVETCRQEITNLPSYPVVKPEILRQAGFYSELQTYKHLHPDVREEKMLAWINTHLPSYPGISPWEFAAATGSTLGMFMLCAAACDSDLTQEKAGQIAQAYFPWINGLHILLDYFIDNAEDRLNGDLNFVSYYKDSEETKSRLRFFGQQALTQAKTLPHPAFAETVVSGLFAMYLSDPKTDAPAEKAIKQQLLKSAGFYSNFMYQLCRYLRTKKKL
ncbi:MAG TPA: tetraprenyl-beta-curcumene synthase family protein [Methylomusa anaerophila]|uniref:Tetraprenyl-beta-curcumene synthase n=1 Tax=Methylomusa anaerophila TaxID=1930071 RepID=A0A348AIB3_9FIRM|nr:tetraprenyl-beta-curcumene synthase family protein [Methylomusa anaerophila]BBB90811.1 tetraprenyl-beta-curcumene synthase [Methylomusa anaerophila]HML90532.1 tetraprenyl-beta-curcumene synthase family protein [Methylomusa anaerophila]